MPNLNIGRLRGGFCVSWRSPDGKRKRFQLAARSKAEAEAEAINVYKRESYASRPKNLTTKDIWEAYRDELGEKPTARTMAYTGKAILPHFGAHDPQQIDNAMCRSYDKKRTAGGISQGSVWTELGHLQSALNSHFGRHTAPKIWRPQKPQSDKRILNASEARALIEAASTPHIRLALILLLGTAGRVGAVLDLTWERVDFKAGTINLRHATAVTRKGRAIVPMNASTRAALSSAKEAALCDYVIEYGGRQVGSIRKGFMNAVDRSNIGHVTIHELRHTAAVTMLGAGLPIEKVSQMLGHSNLAVTFSTYARYMPQHMQDAADVLDFLSVREAR
jgi:integrase